MAQPFEIFVPTYMNKDNIIVESTEAPKRISRGYLKECTAYRLKIEKSREAGQRVIDNIDAGYLIPWENPIQLAINMLNPGGEVFVPAGTYIQTDTTITGVNNFRLRGSGFSSIIKMAKTVTPPDNRLLFLDSISNIEVCHLTFWGDNNTIYLAGDASEHDHAIQITDCQNVSVHHVRIWDMCGDCIYMSGSSTDGVIISEIFTMNTNRDIGTSIGRNSVAVVEGSNILVTKNYLKYGYPAVVDIETNTTLDYTIQDLSITENMIEGGEGYGISIHAACDVGGKTTTVRRVNIAKNTVKNCDMNGLIVWSTGSAGTSEVYDVNVDSNIFYNCDDGVDANRQSIIELNSIEKASITNNRLIAGANTRIGIHELFCNTVNIFNNDILNTTRHGAHLYATSGYETNNIRFVGNKITNASKGNVGTYSGLKADYHDFCEIKNNVATDDQGTPSQNFGYDIDNCDNLRLGGNTCSEYNTAPLQITNVSDVSLLDAVRLGPFFFPSLPANQSLTGMQLGGSSGGFIKVPFNCLLVALSASSLGNITAGTVTIRSDQNGTGLSGHQIQLTSSDGDEKYAIFGDTPYILNEGDRMRIIISSDAGYTPDGSLNWWADLWIIPR